MKPTYSALVFDLGNVLLPFNYEIILSGLDRIEIGLGEKFKRFYRTNYELHRELECGNLSEGKFLEIVLGALDNKLSKEDFCELYSNIFTVNNELVRILPALKKNYKLVLMSNTNGIHQRYGWGKYEFLKVFDKLVLSHEAGAVKPEPEIYKAVEAYTLAQPEEHFYTDDIAEYIAGARLLGWDAVQFTGNGELFTEMDKRGIRY